MVLDRLTISERVLTLFRDRTVARRLLIATDEGLRWLSGGGSAGRLDNAMFKQSTTEAPCIVQVEDVATSGAYDECS